MFKNVLERGSELRRGDFLISNNGKYKATFQCDGNFVISSDISSTQYKPVWASDTVGLDATRLCMQEDCNLVMYNDEDEPRWQANCAKGDCNTCHLSLTNEGVMVVEKDGRTIWDSKENRGMK